MNENYLDDNQREVICSQLQHFNEARFEMDRIFMHQKEVFHIVSSLGLRPFKDGNEWCVLWGDEIQSGISGFGKTPMQAMDNFYMALYGNNI